MDSGLQRARKQCFLKFLADRNNYGSSVVQRSQLTQPCPCSIFQAWSERRFIFSRLKGLCSSIMRMAHFAFLSSFHLPLAVDNYAVTAIGEKIPKLLF